LDSFITPFVSFAIPGGVFTLAKEDSIFTAGPAKAVMQPLVSAAGNLRAAGIEVAVRELLNV